MMPGSKHRISCTRLVLLLLSGLMLAGCTSTPSESPNVVLILADDLGMGDLGAYNPDSRIPTPSMDRLAKQGIRLTDAHSPSAVCSPTRYGLLTGRYAWRTRMKSGVLWTDDPALIDSGRVTMASMLRDRGYATGGFGKWHLGLGRGERTDYADLSSGGPAEAGFDEYYGIPSSLDIPPYVWIREDRIDVPLSDSVEASSMRRSGGGGFWRAGRISGDFVFQDVLGITTDRAVSFIERHAADSDQPFFVYVPLSAPHTPWLPDSSSLGASGAGFYGDFVVDVDRAIGRIVDAVDASGAADNTLVIVTSDNGAHWTEQDKAEWGHLANAAWRGQKADIWEAGHRVPFIARWPDRIAPNTHSSETISLVDMMTTVAVISGISLADSTAEDSWNVLPALLGEAEIERGPLVLHSLNGMFAVRDGDWKLIEGRGSGGFTAPSRMEPGPGEPTGQLYNLALDPGEESNVYTDYPEVVQRLTGLLDEIRTSGRSAPLIP